MPETQNKSTRSYGVSISIPVYKLPLVTSLSLGYCMFGAHPKLPKDTVLLDSDLGDLFVDLFDSVKNSPTTVFATIHIRVC